MKDPELYKASAKLVFRQFVGDLEPLGFSRTRKNFLVRIRPDWVEFVRASCPPLHRDYQLHASIRVLNDSFPAPSIVGPSTHSSDKRFNLWFVNSDTSIARCAADMVSWVAAVAIPWFDGHSTADSLLADGSPLSLQSQAALAESLAGRRSPTSLQLSRKILGLQP